MKVTSFNIKDKSGVALAKISFRAKRNKLKGVSDNKAQKPQDILRKRRKYNFPKEYTRYIEDNYGDVISKEDKDKLMGLVDEHYEEGCIENVEDLHRHIERIGRANGIIFD